MGVDAPFQGNLFANDFLCDSVAETPDWQALDDAALETLEAALRAIFQHFPIAGSPNESQTEDDLIWPVLAVLGWAASLRQQNLSARGREDVPDGLLFADDAAKARVNGFAQEWKRYECGLAAVESKRWLRPLDRGSGQHGEETAPSTQMLRYLRRIDDLTTGKLRWGILTNGARWRLYYQGARSVSEQFFEVDLAAIFDLPGQNEGLFALTEVKRRNALKVFVLVGNTLPIVSIDGRGAADAALLLANFDAVPFDYVARQKIQGQHLNWFIVEQLPVIPPDTYQTVRFGHRTAGEIVREAVLELTYTAHDMAPFARDMGHVDEGGVVQPPFVWDTERRLRLRAKLDAVFFHLYGVTDRDDVRYIYSTFPIVEREETTACGTYRSRDLCLAWMNALAAGDPDAEIVL